MARGSANQSVRVLRSAGMNMKRSFLATLVTVWQWLLGLLLAGLTVYLLLLTRSRGIREGADAADAIRGLLIGAAALAVPAVITLTAAFGLWKGRFWGWALSLGTDVGMTGLLIYSMFDDGELDAALVVLTAAFVVPVVLLMLPVARRPGWHAKAQPSSG